MPDKNWIFDTVALSNFLLSDSIFILENRYRRRGLITFEIYDEISAGMMEYPKLKQIDRLVDDETIKLVSLSRQEREHFRELIVHLGKGEASSIAYAKDRNIIVVTDDRSARKHCSQMNIPVTGTIGILKASVLDGHLKLDQADKVLSKMTDNGYYSPLRSIADII
jgi:predicted nucleic acid-binding protein